MRSDFLLLMLASPSGAGKTTLTHKLRERHRELAFSVSHTTRAPRGTEVDGRDYHFVDRKTFAQMVKHHEFLEWAEVHGNLYGTSKKELKSAEDVPACGGLIFDIDYQGARQIRAKVHEAIGVFVLPPSMEILEKRLRGRSTDTEAVVEKRLQAARLEIDHYSLFDYILVNDDLTAAVDTLAAIVLAERSKRTRKAHLAEALLRTAPIPE